MGKARQGDGMGRMKVDHRRGVAAAVVECGMKRQLLGRRPTTARGAAAVQAARGLLGRRSSPQSRRQSSAGSRKPSEASVGVTRNPPSGNRTLTFPDEPGVRPRSNSERARRQICSRTALSPVNARLPKSGSPGHRSQWRRNCPISGQCRRGGRRGVRSWRARPDRSRGRSRAARCRWR